MRQTDIHVQPRHGVLHRAGAVRHPQGMANAANAHAINGDTPMIGAALHVNDIGNDRNSLTRMLHDGDVLKKIF